ncbi:hypothetical protein [Estrella lausannensis]|uniref:Conserved putative membrane protein n=1 Tax=Estrella lausannensis TaxID=483423 RepID=A0A0H5DPD4_9BACT|nr:hypothetical protein [Estrella lausannensis]CRX38277.1 Conserved putative membrane protein [Estrella lausannensis]
MHYFKAFVAGTVVPTLMLPIATLFLIRSGNEHLLQIPLLHLLPLIWGLWNVFYLAALKKILPKDENTQIAAAGALLGLIVALFAVFEAQIPGKLHAEHLKWVPLIGGPLIYAIVWRFIVKPLNRVFL